ncbi:hypothetical protein DFH11DRAFT_1732197 [Phellopilus nigrolimitatus]|nr:hypothetical protein DFH11DRAFT_1732197 [Phellopilus nigrolimitatus]
MSSFCDPGTWRKELPVGGHGASVENHNQRRFAVVSAHAALVLACGHRIEQVEEVPLVAAVAAAAESLTKAVALLIALGAYADVQKVSSRKLQRDHGDRVSPAPARRTLFFRGHGCALSRMLKTNARADVLQRRTRVHTISRHEIAASMIRGGTNASSRARVQRRSSARIRGL